ncbi:MAG: diaminopimelate decarboxylase [Oscillospiraceae bacterium]|nr:diaminopimelate decarboxylase [Oscillospiraceae bacterium]
MFVSDCLGVNEKGHLTIGEMDTVVLAEQYGTPLYVMDEDEIRKNARAFTSGIEKYYGGKGHVAFACKAFCCKEICRIADSEGLWLDVVSGGETHTALSAGFPVERLIFHGNNKPATELADAIDAGIGRIVVDNIFELELLNQLASAASKRDKVKIQLRIKPGVEAHTHEFITTGQIDSKFGFALETGEAFEAVKKALEQGNIELVGLHCHIGSQIFDVAAFAQAARVMVDFIAKIKNDLGHQIAELNLGGGFGIKYLHEHTPAPYESFMEAVSKVVLEGCRTRGIDVPTIILEPGRSITGPAGITLYTIGALKEIPGVRTYLTVDGGMADNPRYALYQSKYEMLLAGRANAPKTDSYKVAGRCCESGDILGVDVPLPKPKVGEILAVLATGAYNYTMASHYNRLPNPAIVMVKGGKSRVIVRRENYDDLIRNDV